MLSGNVVLYLIAYASSANYLSSFAAKEIAGKYYLLWKQKFIL